MVSRMAKVCSIVAIRKVMCAWGIKNKSQRILSSMIHYECEFLLCFSWALSR